MDKILKYIAHKMIVLVSVLNLFNILFELKNYTKDQQKFISKKILRE